MYVKNNVINKIYYINFFYLLKHLTKVSFPYYNYKYIVRGDDRVTILILIIKVEQKFFAHFMLFDSE